MTLQWTPDCVSTTTALGLEGKQQPLLLHAVLYFAFLPPFLRHLYVLRPTFVTKSIVNNAVPLILLPSQRRSYQLPTTLPTTTPTTTAINNTGTVARYTSDAEQWNPAYGADEKGCPKRTMASQLLMNRCLPQPVGAVSDLVDSAMNAIDVDGMAASFMNDLEKVKVPLITLSVVASRNQETSFAENLLEDTDGLLRSPRC